jgi:methyl-accepting chemotaxis protein
MIDIKYFFMAMYLKKLKFLNLSVKKKLMLGFILSAIFIIIIGSLSMLSIYKASEAAMVQSEMEHQTSIIRNIRIHFISNKANRTSNTKIINSNYNELLKCNARIIDFLENDEKQTMDTLRDCIIERRDAMQAYFDNMVIYDSLTTHLMLKLDAINNHIINRLQNHNSTHTLYANSSVLLKQLSKAQLRPSSFNFNQAKKSALVLEQNIALSKDKKAINLITEFIAVLNNLKEIHENEWKITSKSYPYLTNTVSYTNQLVKIHHEKANNELSLLRTLIIIISVLGAFVVYISSHMASNSTIKAIDSLKGIANHVSKGKIGTQIPEELLNRKDEIGSLSSSFNSMLKQFKKTILEINSCSAQILDTGNELKESSQLISVSSNQQASSLEEISSTLEEIVANIHQNAQNSQKTKSKARATATGIKQLKEQNNLMYTSSVEIDLKTKIINEIALQTNILSLNAAVQAATAGVYGKSFSVVAAEVKRLSEKSNETANNISKLTGSGLDITKEGNILAENLVPEIETTYQLVSEIAEASKEQQIGVEQINDALVSLNSVSQENSFSADKLSQNANHLHQQSNNLKSAINFFSVQPFSIKSEKKTSFFKSVCKKNIKKKNT